MITIGEMRIVVALDVLGDAFEVDGGVGGFGVGVGLDGDELDGAGGAGDGNGLEAFREAGARGGVDEGG